MKKKVKILRIVSSLNPKYGGPAKAIIDSSLMLVRQGFEVDILTSDNHNSKFIKSKEINIINKGPGIGNYCFNLKLFFWLFKNRAKYEKFIIHGIWEFNTFIARLLLKDNFYVFTHGQLDPFFKKQTFKKMKKLVYWKLLEKKNLSYSKSLLLTSLNEKKLLDKTYVDTTNLKKTVVRYGLNKPNFNINNCKKKFYKKFPYLVNKEFYLYLGRFHEKKGCEILIKAIKKIVKHKKNIYVLMAGPESKYKNKMKNLSNSLGLEENILWSDIILNDLKWGAISASKAMVLSSHGENFGVSLVESLSCHRPVITTKKVNIFNEIRNSKAGFISNDNLISFFKTLRKFDNLKRKKIRQMNMNSFKCFTKYFDLSEYKNSLAEILLMNK